MGQSLFHLSGGINSTQLRPLFTENSTRGNNESSATPILWLQVEEITVIFSSDARQLE